MAATISRLAATGVLVLVPLFDVGRRLGYGVRVKTVSHIMKSGSARPCLHTGSHPLLSSNVLV